MLSSCPGRVVNLSNVEYTSTHVCEVAGFATISYFSLSGYSSLKINKPWVTNTTARASNGGRCRVLVPTCPPLLPHVLVVYKLQSEYGTVSLVTSRPTVQHTSMTKNKINILFRLSTVGYSKCQLQWTERDRGFENSCKSRMFEVPKWSRREL